MTVLCGLAGMLTMVVILLGLSSAMDIYMIDNVTLFQIIIATLKLYFVMIIIGCISNVGSLALNLSLSAILPLIFSGFWLVNEYVL